MEVSTDLYIRQLSQLQNSYHQTNSLETRKFFSSNHAESENIEERESPSEYDAY